MEDPRIKRVVLVTLSLLSLFLLTKTGAELQGYRYIGSYPTQASVISVNGKGEVSAVPDIATFSFSVTEESLVVKEAQERAAKTTNAILDYLKKNGVADKDTQTSGYSIYPRYDYGKTPVMGAPAYYPVPPSPDGKRNLAAYVVTQSVTVKIRKLEDAGKILSGIGELGATDVSGISFDLDKRDELVKKAREKAISEARSEANKLAKALGVRLVRIVSYNENGNYPIYYNKAYDVAPMEAGRGGAVAPQIPVGEDKIVSNVSITYEIK